ncbi:DUF1877 family protein [Streptomyces sp. NPDC001817]|uniref:DUF1877 family protein n=1 Tax=Streptomyces sp. NPDC001817 TaxID=3154398 RepID=UPI00331E230A
MGITRHEESEILALLDHPEGPESGREQVRNEWYDDAEYPRPGSRLRTLESVYITRTWDAIHVLLTGRENIDEVDFAPPTGEPPACDVIMGGSILNHRGRGHALRMNNLLLLMPDEVQAVDAFLKGIDLDCLIRERGHLLEELDVYSFYMTVELPDGRKEYMNMLEDGSLVEDLGVLRDFYARAAASGNCVIKDIS